MAATAAPLMHSRFETSCLFGTKRRPDDMEMVDHTVDHPADHREKKYKEDAIFRDASFVSPSFQKRMAELTLNENLLKRARMARPKYKTANAKINLTGKQTYTQQEVDMILKRLMEIHNAELDEQYNTFQTIINDCLMSSRTPPSYIN
jgi:hypothetical protein